MAKKTDVNNVTRTNKLSDVPTVNSTFLTPMGK